MRRTSQQRDSCGDPGQLSEEDLTGPLVNRLTALTKDVPMSPAILAPPAETADSSGEYLTVPNTAIAIGASVDVFRRKVKRLPALAGLLVQVGPLRMFRRGDLAKVREALGSVATG